MIKMVAVFAKKVGDSLPVITLLYFVIAYVYMQAYFIPFHIYVSDYYEYSEIFLPVVFPLLLVGIVGAYLLVSYDAQRISDSINEARLSALKANQKNQPKNKLVKWAYSILTITSGGWQTETSSRVIRSVFSLGFLVVAGLILRRTGQITPMVLASFCLALYILPVQWLFSPRERVTLQRSYAMLWMLLVILTIGLWRYSYAKTIIKSPAVYQLSGMYKGKFFSTGKDLLYIGTANNYYLFYHRTDSNTLIIQRKEIDSVLIKDRGDISFDTLVSTGIVLKDL